MEMQNSELNKRLRGVEDEITLLAHHSHMYSELYDIILRHPRLLKMDLTLISWMMRISQHDLVIRVGRILDKSSGTISLIGFLEDLKKDKNLISRKNFKKRCTQAWSDERYDKYAGKGTQEFPLNKIKKDLNDLNSDPCSKISKFRHNHIAHLSKERELPPKIDELYASLDVIEEIISKYHLLLTGQQWGGSKPIILRDWKEVLTVPWINT